MASNSVSDAAKDLPAGGADGQPRAQGTPSSQPGGWLLGKLDSFLSAELRKALPSERVRYRVLAGASLFLLMMCVLLLGYGLWMARSPLATGLGIFVLAGCVVTLVLLRKKGAVPGSALILCISVSLGIFGAIFYGGLLSSTHVSAMLGPLLAVYLLQPRVSLIITAMVSVVLSLAFPLYYLSVEATTVPYSQAAFWELHIFAGVSIMAGWGLGALHSAARNEAEAALHKALKNFSESESKLTSLIESTDDLVCSLDLDGRLMIANTAVKNAYMRLFGEEATPGKAFFRKERAYLWEQRYEAIKAGRRMRFEEEYVFGTKKTIMETSFNPIRGEDGQITGVTLVSRNITARKETEAQLGDMHRTLLDVSRQAGMAEVATGVLHNVGNTLNSVNISVNVVTDKLRKLRVAGFLQAAELLGQQSGQNLSAFLTNDPRGQQLPAYFRALAEHLRQEQQILLDEMESLSRGIDHIKSIVSMQQEHAKTIGAVEMALVPQIVDEALRLHISTFAQLGIHIECDYAEMSPIMLDRHKLLQILMNLLTNARQSIMEADKKDKRLIIRVRRVENEQKLRIEMTDTGVGIASENLQHIFTQGFTTKKKGHGFGLHISALAAAEMKGKLSCSSPGPGQGATFTIELPMEVNEPAKASEPAKA